MPALPTVESASGSWATARAEDAESCGMRHSRGVADTLTAQTRAWPTPSAMNPNDGQDPATYESRRRRLQEAHGNGNGAGLVLAQAVRRPAWPTPTTAEADKIPNQANYGQVGLSTHPAMRGAPTRAPLSKGEKGGAASRAEWATATANDAKNNSGPAQEVQYDGGRPLNVQAGGALNPEWVETLMGWPRGWTALQPLLEVTFSPWPAPPGPQHPWEPPRLAQRVPGRTARLRMLGNGQVPATAVLAWRLLSEAM